MRDNPLNNKGEKTSSEDVPDSFFIPEDPPRNDPPIEEDIKVTFEEDSTLIAALPTQTTFPYIIPSTSKVPNDFSLSLSTDEIHIEDKDGDKGKQAQSDQENEPKGTEDSDDSNDDDDQKYEDQVLIQIHDDMISATKELIKKSHVRHEKYQHLEKEIRKKDGINMNMQQMDKLKTKMTEDTFRATQSMPPPIPTLTIWHIDIGSPIKKSDYPPKEPLIPRPSELFITLVAQQIISSTSTLNAPMKDKGKGINF
ncbi:unnamed protein product [Lactuca saligna]|uniref:Uncharacterized protein n=1 Tax=Lactuca saligna TaxID=75948 RepID=A0AA35ZQS6_LACSI|nr:unnamed protein product [Lactuca saligna]